MNKKIRLYYSDSKPNLGDIVNPILLKHLLKNHDVVHASPYKADFFALGSILGKLTAPQKDLFARLRGALAPAVSVWSSGFIDELPTGMTLTRQVNVLALRGACSQQIMEKLLNKKLDIPWGDGGLLLPELLTEVPEKKYDTGIVPHYKELESEAITTLAQKIHGSTIISPLGDPLAALRKIAQCRTIISSSLHGLIVADSMHIPSMQISCTDKIRGGMFKYRDYYSAYGLDVECKSIVELLNAPPTAEDIIRNYRISFDQVQELQGKLRNALLNAIQ